MQLYQQKMTKPKTDVSPLKSILYVVTMIYEKNIYKPRNHKGISENTFWKKYASHKSSLNNNNKDTIIEKWNLKAENTNPKVTWAVKPFSEYNPESKKCLYIYITKHIFCHWND